MRGFPAQKRLKTGLVLAFAIASTLSVAACSDLDSLFGGSDNEDISASDAAAPTAGSTDQAVPQAAPIGEAPAPVGPTAVAGGAPIATIAPVSIEAGGDTGTAVNKTIQSLRSEVAGLNQRLTGEAQRLAELRNAGASAAGAYQQSKAAITTRLQIGTTKGNPELVAQWNNAQSALDGLSGNLNQLNALGTEVANDSSSAHFALDLRP